MNKTTSSWKRMQFKNHKVYLMVDAQENPIIKNGKVLIKYNLTQDYEYWVHPENVTPIRPDALKRKSSTGKESPARRKKTIASTQSLEAIIKQPDTVIIFTDGASSGNPGPSGIGVVLRHGDHKKEISKSIGRATNNIAELEAIRVGLSSLKHTHLPVRIFTDSAYAQGVLTLGWKAKKNTKLIQSIKRLMSRFDDIELIKVPGHSGIEENERADALAVAGVKGNYLD